MCWTGKIDDKKIAEKDIVCKKIITHGNGKYFSYFRGMEYEFNKLYEVELEMKVTESGHVLGNSGLHCYSNEICVKRNERSKELEVSYTSCEDKFGEVCLGSYFRSPVYRKVDEGECKKVCSMANPVLVECIVPKGAMYFENNVGEIISDQLILTKIVYSL